nr:type I-E CRISPR-associated protein Cse2/CasB [Micromonospora sp. DSM 115978]
MPNGSATTGYYWDRQVDADGKWRKDEPPGGDLAAMRRGAGREAGDVPEMWRFYSKLTRDGRRSRDLEAEHAALTLFAIHQQSKRRPMHRHGIGLGTAMRALRLSGKFSTEAVDRRFSAAATATSFPEVRLHLRGLITQLRTIDQPLDYTQLCKDLSNWQSADQVSRVRRTWGGQYFVKDDVAQPETNPVVPKQARPTDPSPTLQEML